MTTSRLIKKLMFGGVVSAALLSLPAQAVYTINITQSGADVVMTGTGTVNTAGLTLKEPGGCDATGYVVPSVRILCIGTTNSGLTRYSGLTQPLVAFGAAIESYGTSSSGHGITLVSDEIDLPNGYASGAPLASTASFAGKTITSMGLTPGTYTWTFGSGANADSVVLNIAPAVIQSVPTLGEYGMMALASLLAMSGIAYARKRQG